MPLSEHVTKEIEALCRAMPITRMVDYGMTREKALRAHREVRAGKRWDLALVEIAQEEQTHAEAAADAALAREHWHAAAASLIFAQMAFNADSDRKRDLYRRMTQCFASFAALSKYPAKKIEVSYRNATLLGWQFQPPDGPSGATVIAFGGMSGWSTAYRSMAEALCVRGIGCLLVDGPGQGESRLEGGVYADADVATGFSRFIDLAVTASADQRIGLWGNSYGGLLAALTAGRDDRVLACCINGAPSRTDVPPFRTAQEQLAAMFGCEDPVSLGRAVAPLAFDPRRTPLSCATLVLEGGADVLVAPGSQRTFLEGNPNPKSRLQAWPDGEHTIYNHPLERNTVVADWFKSVLAPENSA
ncbi:S9 family peptidase [Bradyrhizobium sp. CCBAU 51765]|uniref:alpha/beta hydrolase family protein n=1 Tax=Bradyrhizobium sp. CCBAU 51765 TaxID=1325102 RepID=UPI001889C041|nr:alpha/beta fold hydrolase [Bradyrhizobium sp. CCBAU 51765]QOZ06525.1 dipeptidyl aminopeptidase [Bradyrhizobium sp. CCBAU 51765]